MRNATFLRKPCKKTTETVIVSRLTFNYHRRIGRNKNRESRVKY